MTTLARGRAPNYRLTADVGDLPQGTFVCPVEFNHLPKHIKDVCGPYFNQEREVMCYTPKGFKPIQRAQLEPV